MKTFREFIEEALTTQVVRGASRQQYQRQALQQRVSGGNQTTPSQIFQRPQTITGFRTARGSTYSFKPSVNNIPGSSTRTAANDPFHPTKPGVKQSSDWTIFTTPSAGQSMKAKWNQGVSRTEFFKGEPVSKTPAVGRSPVEVWNKYQGGGRAMHLGNRITDIQTATPGSGIGLYGKQRQELRQRVNTALQKPQNRETLRRQSGMKPRGGSSSLSNVGRGVQQRPSGIDFTPGTGGNFGISGIGLAN